jgi:hypothetical protein
MGEGTTGGECKQEYEVKECVPLLLAVVLDDGIVGGSCGSSWNAPTLPLLLLLIRTKKKQQQQLTITPPRLGGGIVFRGFLRYRSFRA